MHDLVLGVLAQELLSRSGRGRRLGNRQRRSLGTEPGQRIRLVLVELEEHKLLLELWPRVRPRRDTPQPAPHPRTRISRTRTSRRCHSIQWCCSIVRAVADAVSA